MIDLHPFTRGDFARLIGWADSPEFLMQWSGPLFTYPLDEAQLEMYLQGAETDPPKEHIFKALDTTSGEVLSRPDKYDSA